MQGPREGRGALWGGLKGLLNMPKASSPLGGTYPLVFSFTTETYNNQVANYISGSQLEWREVETGQLPSSGLYQRATTVDNVIYVTGGGLSSILSWDPSSESWQPVGSLAVDRRMNHAAVAVPSWIIESGCLHIISGSNQSAMTYVLFAVPLFLSCSLKM